MLLSSVTKILVTLISAGIHFQVSSSPVAYYGNHASLNKAKSGCGSANAKNNSDTAKPVDKMAAKTDAYGQNGYDYAPSKSSYGDYQNTENGKKYQEGGDQYAYPQGSGQNTGSPQQGSGSQPGSGQSQGGGAGQEGGYPSGGSQNGGGGDQSQGGVNSQSGVGGGKSQGEDNKTGGGGDQGAYPDKGQGVGDSGSGGGSIDEQMLKAVNAERSKEGRKALVLNKELTKAAQDHSKWQSENKKMDHTGEGGSDPSTRCKKAGYGGQCAENVAFNQADIAQVMDSWMKSTGHRENILNAQYTEMGAAMVDLYWTQNFGSSGSGGGGSGGSPGQGSGAYPDGGNNQQQGSGGNGQQQGSGGDSQQQGPGGYPGGDGQQQGPGGYPGGDGQQQGPGGYPGGDGQQQGSGGNNQQQGSGAYDQQQQGYGNSPYQQGSVGDYSRYDLGGY